MKPYENYSAKRLQDRIDAYDKRTLKLVGDVINAGFGNLRMSELRDMRGTNKVIDKYLDATDVLNDLHAEADYRKRYHGSLKPVKRRNNPMAARKRKVKKKRTAAQKRATANLVKLNKQRAKKKTTKKKTRRKVTARKSNPTRRNAFKVFRIKNGKVDFYGGVGTWGHSNNRALLFRTKADANAALYSAYSQRYQHGIAPENATVAEIKKAVYSRASTAGKK